MKLKDSFDRQINYLRLSVTDHCNYRCFYCRPADDSAGSLNKEFLNADEIARIARIFTELGVQKIRLTGGEPLIRKDIDSIVSKLGELKLVKNLSLSTNAHLLEKHAQSLKDSGLDRVNISLDTLKADRFHKITRCGDLPKVLAGIEAAIATNLNPIKINMVIMRGINDDEIENMLQYVIERKIQLRFIETMPIGSAGARSLDNFYSADKILEKVEDYCKDSLIEIKPRQDAGPARLYKIKNTGVKVGVISAMSQHFCDTCNRVRLTAKGRLVLCLGQENSVLLRDAIRSEKNDDTIKSLIIDAVAKKPERHEFISNENNVANRQMVNLGG